MERRITRKSEERKVETGNQYRTIECWRKKMTSVNGENKNRVWKSEKKDIQ